MDDKYCIPQHLDQPFRIYLLTVDELILLIVPMILGFVLNQITLGFCAGILFVFGFKRVKGEQGSNYLLSLVYWYFPNVIQFMVTPPSYIREYLG